MSYIYYEIFKEEQEKIDKELIHLLQEISEAFQNDNTINLYQKQLNEHYLKAIPIEYIVDRKNKELKVIYSRTHINIEEKLIQSIHERQKQIVNFYLNKYPHLKINSYKDFLQLKIDNQK